MNMTNREWLNSLSDDELAEWLCDCLYDERLSKICGTPINTGVNTVKLSFMHSLLGMKKWIKEERRENER